MSGWLRKICCAWGVFLCFPGTGLALDEPTPVLKYSFIVVIGYDDIPPEGIEMEYKSMQECLEGQDRVVEKLESEEDPKLTYLIIDCAKTTES